MKELKENGTKNGYFKRNGSISSRPAVDKVRPADKLYTCDPSGCVKLRESFEIDEAPITVPTLFQQNCLKYADHPAVGYRVGTEWKTVSYNEYFNIVRTVAKAFLKLGLERYHSVCILGVNAPEWFYSDLAAIMAGGFATGIYITNSAEACLHCLSSSRANIVVVDSEKQLQKILQVKDRVPTLKTIIQYADAPKYPGVYSWNSVLEIGNAEPDSQLDNITKDIAVNECCTLVYTSGTTSFPKAVMLSHDNLIFNTKIVTKYLEMKDGERILSYLPLSHAAAQTADLYAGIVTGSTIYFADKDALKGTLVENLRGIHPTILFGVPRVWEKIKEGIEAVERKAPRLKQYFLSSAKSVGLSHYKSISDGHVGETFLFRMFKNMVYSKVKEAVGFQYSNEFLSGAAPIPLEVKEYLSSYDMPICEVYGMSETSGAHCLSKASDFQFHSIGRTVPGARTKINQPDEKGFGEVCMFGRHVFMGYLNEPEKTQEVFDTEGWLHSGDIGTCNENSFIQITGRIKDILITAGGENIAPSLIELLLKAECPVISQAVVVGERCRYLSVLITLKCNVNLDTGAALDELAPEAKEWFRSLGCPFETVSEVVRKNPKLLTDSIQAAIDRTNLKAISNAHKIQKFAILPRDFSLASGELGPTMKVIRRNVFQNYKDTIEKLYS